MILETISAIGGLILPPVVDFVKKKWLKKGEDSPEATLSTLATTKPEIMAPYVTALGGYLKDQVAFFNRDVIGLPSQWVINLRAAIRPSFVAVSLFVIVVDIFYKIDIDPGLKDFMILNISSWFGDRLVKK
jgi:hypothetical protein